MRREVARHPDDLELATTAAEIVAARKRGHIAVLMGLEGGHAIDSDLSVLRSYAELGVRYLTLTHTNHTPWADSSAKPGEHNGLTDFGRQVVRELNRLGMMVDISHVSDKTFQDALDASAAPVIASHSSSRALASAPRNMTDDMMRALAKKGGVVHINFYEGFLDNGFAKRETTLKAEQAEQDAIDDRTPKFGDRSQNGPPSQAQRAAHRQARPAAAQPAAGSFRARGEGRGRGPRGVGLRFRRGGRLVSRRDGGHLENSQPGSRFDGARIFR